MAERAVRNSTGGLFVGLPDAAHHFKAVHAGHHHVCHQHVGTEVEELAQSLFTVCCGVDDEVLPSNVSLIIMARVCSSSTRSTVIFSIIVAFCYK